MNHIRLMNNDITLTHNIVERIRSLALERRKILSLPSEQALSAILDYPQPVALIQSFTDEDFYFLVHDIGAEDALEILELASFKQWDHILDLEIWNRDRIDWLPVSKWLALLFETNPNRFIYWFLNHGTDIMEFYLWKNLEVIVREHDQDPSDFDDDFQTIDDIFYFRFNQAAADTFSSDERESRDVFLSKFMKQLAAWDHTLYQNILIGLGGIIAAESEEELWRLRNVRLAEKGFMPFNEASSIYQPLKPTALTSSSIKYLKLSDHSITHQSLYPIGVMNQTSPFVKALQTIDTAEVLMNLQAEFAGLCNQIISADQQPVKNREDLARVVNKVCGYLSIGLELLMKQQDLPTIHKLSALITKYPLANLFRIGYGLTAEIKREAESWLKTSWFASHDLPLSFWAEEWLGVLGGLLLKRPLFFCNYHQGKLYREFKSSADIQQTAEILNRIKAYDNMLSRMQFDFNPDLTRVLAANGLLNHQNFLLTLWARHVLNMEATVDYIELDVFKPFFEALWQTQDTHRTIHPAAKESFYNWLSHTLDETNQSLLYPVYETMLKAIVDELGQVRVDDIRQEFVYLFLLKNKAL